MRQEPIDRDKEGRVEPHQAYTDAEYISGVQRGDQGVFNSLVRTYFTMLVQFVVGIVRAQDNAEDIVQDVLYWIWRHRETWQPRGSLRAYLLRAVRNHALDWLKHVAVEERYQRESIDLEAELTPAADLALMHAQDSQALAQALAQLPERRRAVIQLRYYRQLSHAEIGEILGLSPKAVKELLHRTIETLRQRLGSSR